MGIGFIVGAITCKMNKPFAEAVDKGVDKGMEIVEDIKGEMKAQTKKKQEE